MKLIIEMPDSEYNDLKGLYLLGLETPAYKTFIEKTCVEAIANGIPYDPSGDLISREALKEKAYTAVILEPDEKGIDYVKGKRYVVDLDDIDNAQTVQPKYSLLPLECTDMEDAFNRGYRAGKIEGILKRKAGTETPSGDAISREALKEDFKSRLADCNEWIEKAKDKETKIRASAVKTFIGEGGLIWKKEVEMKQT